MHEINPKPRKIRQKGSQGFTLIELVIVIAIIGILSAVAIPKFINLSSNAQTAATNAVDSATNPPKPREGFSSAQNAA